MSSLRTYERPHVTDYGTLEQLTTSALHDSLSSANAVFSLVAVASVPIAPGGGGGNGNVIPPGDVAGLSASGGGSGTLKSLGDVGGVTKGGGNPAGTINGVPTIGGAG